MFALILAATLAFCPTWTLTETCADDWFHVTLRPGIGDRWIRLVYGGNTYTLDPGTSWHHIGCFEGTIRVTTLTESWVENEPKFFHWEGDPGRLEDIDCGDDCRQVRQRRNPGRRHLCEAK